MIDEYKEVIEDILGDFGFRVKWKFYHHWANVWVYEITGRSEEDLPLFDKANAQSFPDPVDNIEDAQTYLDGYIKWDGCTELNQGCPHWCGVTYYVKHVKLLRYLHRRAFELMEQPVDGEWEEND